jgi:hypothetical protein
LKSKINIQTLLVLLLVVACFFGGIRFERERQRRENEAAQPKTIREFLEQSMRYHEMKLKQEAQEHNRTEAE